MTSTYQKISSQHLVDICKFSKGSEECIFLASKPNSKDFCCLKDTPLEDSIVILHLRLKNSLIENKSSEVIPNSTNCTGYKNDGKHI